MKLERRVEARGQRHSAPVLAVGSRLRPLDEWRRVGEVAGAAGQQHEGALESPRGGPLSLLHPQVPLARHVGVVAGLLQQRRDGDDAVREVAFVARLVLLVGVGFSEHGAEAGGMGVDAGEQHRARGRARGRDEEAREQQARARERVEVRRADLAARDAQVRVAEVVGDDQQDARARVSRRRARDPAAAVSGRAALPWPPPRPAAADGRATQAGRHPADRGERVPPRDRVELALVQDRALAVEQQHERAPRRRERPGHVALLEHHLEGQAHGAHLVLAGVVVGAVRVALGLHGDDVQALEEGREVGRVVVVAVEQVRVGAVAAVAGEQADTQQLARAPSPAASGRGRPSSSRPRSWAACTRPERACPPSAASSSAGGRPVISAITSAVPSSGL